MQGWGLKRIGRFYHELNWNMGFMLSLWFRLNQLCFILHEVLFRISLLSVALRKMWVISKQSWFYLCGAFCLFISVCLLFICGGLLGRSCSFVGFFVILKDKILICSANENDLMWAKSCKSALNIDLIVLVYLIELCCEIVLQTASQNGFVLPSSVP